jgi:hypothetical protein
MQSQLIDYPSSQEGQLTLIPKQTQVFSFNPSHLTSKIVRLPGGTIKMNINHHQSVYSMSVLGPLGIDIK